MPVCTFGDRHWPEPKNETPPLAPKRLLHLNVAPIFTFGALIAVDLQEQSCTPGAPGTWDVSLSPLMVTYDDVGGLVFSLCMRVCMCVFADVYGPWLLCTPPFFEFFLRVLHLLLQKRLFIAPPTHI